MKYFIRSMILIFFEHNRILMFALNINCNILNVLKDANNANIALWNLKINYLHVNKIIDN